MVLGEVSRERPPPPSSCLNSAIVYWPFQAIRSLNDLVTFNFPKLSGVCFPSTTPYDLPPPYVMPLCPFPPSRPDFFFGPDGVTVFFAGGIVSSTPALAPGYQSPIIQPYFHDSYGWEKPPLFFSRFAGFLSPVCCLGKPYGLRGSIALSHVKEQKNINTFSVYCPRFDEFFL